MKNSQLQDKMVNSDRVLYTPSAFAKNNLMYLQEIGHLQALSTHTSKRSRLSSFLFFYVQSGSGTLTYEDSSYALSAGDCVFLDCRKTYSHQTSEDLWHLQWTHFDGPNLKEIHAKFIGENDSPVFRPLYVNVYENILNELQELTALENNVRDMFISEKLSGLLAQIMNDCQNRDSYKIIPQKSLVLVEIKKYLDEHFCDKITLEELSKLFYIDKYYLTRRFKQHYGTTVNTYLQQQKITHSKHLLRFSDLSVEQIANECGIDDPNYFARLFKKIEGITPGEFRRSWKGSK